MDLKKIVPHYRQPKKLIRKSNFSDPYFVSKYAFSPYMACSHACKYCDGRAEKYYVEGDFETDIVVRQNIPELLEQELPKLRENGTIIIGSGISDPYQNIEEREQLMRASLQIMIEHSFSVSVMTKSHLILRDLDLIKQIHQQSGFCLMVSLTFTDDEERKVFEPGASSVEERLAMIQKFKQNGIPIGVLTMPFIPFISATEPNIEKLFRKLKDLQVDFIMPGDLTLRPGRQKETFLKIIQQQYPELNSRFESLYRENKVSGAPLSSYSKNIYAQCEQLLGKLGITPEIPHAIYQGKFPLYDEAFILLHHMKNLYHRKGIDILPLKRELAALTDWLKVQKPIFNRKRSWNQDCLEKEFIAALEDNNKPLIKNEKLNSFLRKILKDKKIFDYRTLKTSP